MASNLNRQLWISFSIIVASVCAAAVACYFLTGTITSVITGIIADKELIQKQAGALGVVAQLKQQASQAVIYQAAMNQLLPQQDGLIGFSQWVRDIAGKHQVIALVSFQTDSIPPTDSAAGSTGFSLGVTGGVSDIIAFLADIESKSPGFLLHINSFDLTNQGGAYQYNGQGSLFFR